MSKGLKIVLMILCAYLTLSFLHVWLNVGFSTLGLIGSDKPDNLMRVGFLPVT
jgi:hypothetical protein